MYIFNETTISGENGIIFLCGTQYNQSSKSDKRNVLSNYLKSQFPHKKIIILEQHFTFSKNPKNMLCYDDIFLKDLNDIESLTAAFANCIIIIHDSISTGAELALFASRENLRDKICILVPDEIGVEEDKIGNFLHLAFFRNHQNAIKQIRYFPKITNHHISLNHIEKWTSFPDNDIKRHLQNEINSFILQTQKPIDIKYCKIKYNRIHKETNIISYSYDDDRLQVHVGAEVILYQILSMFQFEDIRKEMRVQKLFHKHISFLEEQYKTTMINSVQKLCTDSPRNIIIQIKGLDVDLRKVIGFCLYMYQALGLIKITKNTDNTTSISSSQKLNDEYKNLKSLVNKLKQNNIQRLLND